MVGGKSTARSLPKRFSSSWIISSMAMAGRNPPSLRNRESAREHCMGTPTPSVFSRDGSLLPSIYAAARYIDAVIVFSKAITWWLWIKKGQCSKRQIRSRATLPVCAVCDHPPSRHPQLADQDALEGTCVCGLLRPCSPDPLGISLVHEGLVLPC